MSLESIDVDSTSGKGGGQGQLPPLRTRTSRGSPAQVDPTILNVKDASNASTWLRRFHLSLECENEAQMGPCNLMKVWRMKRMILNAHSRRSTPKVLDHARFLQMHQRDRPFLRRMTLLSAKRSLEVLKTQVGRRPFVSVLTVTKKVANSPFSSLPKMALHLQPFPRRIR